MDYGENISCQRDWERVELRLRNRTLVKTELHWKLVEPFAAETRKTSVDIDVDRARHEHASDAETRGGDVGRCDINRDNLKPTVSKPANCVRQEHICCFCVGNTDRVAEAQGLTHAHRRREQLSTSRGCIEIGVVVEGTHLARA
jgi:hypothetical protein